MKSPAKKSARKTTAPAAGRIDDKPVASGLGLRIRHARLVAGLTLLQLAQKADCSESLISKIERGSAVPSLATLHRLAMALDSNISNLTSEEKPAGGPILREGERTVIRAGGGVALERLVPPTRGGLLQANIHIVAPGKASEGMIEHVGEEVGYILEGKIELRLGKERHVLQAGDAFTFSSSVPHGYRNIGTKSARILWVNSPATF